MTNLNRDKNLVCLFVLPLNKLSIMCINFFWFDEYWFTFFEVCAHHPVHPCSYRKDSVPLVHGVAVKSCIVSLGAQVLLLKSVKGDYYGMYLLVHCLFILI